MDLMLGHVLQAEPHHACMGMARPELGLAARLVGESSSRHSRELVGLDGEGTDAGLVAVERHALGPPLLEVPADDALVSVDTRIIPSA
jgi:hypothetical protein